MAKKSLAEQIAELQKPEIEDYDIEDAERDVFNHDDEENASLGEDEEDEVKRTEHYVNVGKSKLRDHSVNLKDPKYTGKTSSRKDIFENSDEEDVDDEESEDVSEQESNEEESEDESQSENEEKEGDESDSGTSLRADSEDEEQSESESERSTDEETVTSKRDKLKQMMATERKTILNRLSTSAQNDALKGYAVISQQRSFDNILDSRIKLQKV